MVIVLKMFTVPLLVLICGATVHAGPHIASIAGGKSAKPHQFPFMVRVDAINESLAYENGTVKEILNDHCTAFLIPVRGNEEQSDIVLTSAKCVLKRFIEVWRDQDVNVPEEEYIMPSREYADRNNRRLVLGAHSTEGLEEGVEVREIEKAIHHPGFQFKTSLDANDIAVVKLDKPVKFSSTIKPIRLQRDNESVPIVESAVDPITDQCKIAGWGKVDDTNSSEELQYMNVNIGDCTNDWAYCIRSGSLRSPTACEGDQGSPLFCDINGETVAFGLNQYQGSCDSFSAHNLYMRLDLHAQWIADRITELSVLISSK